jgi:23S rRNA (cytidine1920-2'-O)/16S rRNA (cytidine1409-2'-O)-methyltransferase
MALSSTSPVNSSARSALKLIAGLDAASISPTGRVCLDVGSSTGGFTQVLAGRGAARIYAVDVGSDQLHSDIRALPAVVSLEQTNARDLTSNEILEPIDLLVCDVSFVSVTKVLDVPLAFCHPGADAVILIKPQFEVGRDAIGKGGVVTDAEAVDRATQDVVTYMAGHGWDLRRALPSPIAGGDGNSETVAVFRRR